MALKQCSMCDRKFTKLEHVRRHERSHTKERPYECPTCGKLFSRSDVLFRHCKGHTDDTSGKGDNSHQDEASNQQQQDSNQVLASGSDGISMSQPHPALVHQPGSFMSDIASQSYPSSRLSSTAGGQEPYYSSEDAIDPSLPTTLLMQPMANLGAPDLNQGDGRIEALMTAASHLEPSAKLPWNSPSTINMSPDGGHPFAQHRNILPSNVDPSLQFRSQPGQASVTTLDQWAFQLLQNNHPVPNRTPNETFQTWLFPSNHDMVSSNEPEPMDTNLRFDNYGASNVKMQQATQPASILSLTSNIPAERFSRVESCWPTPSSKAFDFMHVLWNSLITSPSTNILCESSTDVAWSPPSRTDQRHSRWGFDEQCRNNLQRMLRNLRPTTDPKSSSTGNAVSSLNEARINLKPDDIEFPPAEILDIAIEMYFYYFHPTISIVHFPTFSIRHADPSLAFCMCLIGLSILGTAGALTFVSKTVMIVFHAVSSEVRTLTANNLAPETQMRIFATGLLALNLAAMHGIKSRMMQAEAIYKDLVAVAQQRGLFAAIEGPLPNVLIDRIEDTDARWQAWSRVDCAKRIIFGILQVDCWFTAYLSTAPIIRSESVKIFPPSEFGLYQARNASTWLQLSQQGARIHSEYIGSSQLSIPAAKLDASTFASLLSISLLRVHEANNQLQNASFEQKILEPWRVLSGDARDRDLISLLTNLALPPLNALGIGGLNSDVLWHASCMMLGGNILYFELAAGRAGPNPAAAALENIRTWCQTASARRAVLHSAQIFKLLSDRKNSDIVDPHSVVASFRAALIMGLYTFMLPPADPAVANNPCIELLDPIDWARVGQTGLQDETLTPGAQVNPIDYPASQFIRKGGPFTICSIVILGGYLAARRTLLHFASMMDGIGRWKSKTFSQILHIMSDDLTDASGTEEEFEALR